MVQIKGALPGLSLVPHIACCVSFAGTAAVRREGRTAVGVPGVQVARPAYVLLLMSHVLV